MNQPVAYFMTWNTYGTWLPGDSRGWVEYRHGWQLPDPILHLESAARMTESACQLSHEQRQAVEDQIKETCQYRGWYLHAVNCRSNHIHVVVSSADAKPCDIRSGLKAWATRCLKKRFDPVRENWWAERGSIRHLFDDRSLRAAIIYTIETQDRKTSSSRIISDTHLPPQSPCNSITTRSVSKGISSPEASITARSVSKGNQDSHVSQSSKDISSPETNDTPDSNALAHATGYNHPVTARSVSKGNQDSQVSQGSKGISSPEAKATGYSDIHGHISRYRNKEKS